MKRYQLLFALLASFVALPASAQDNLFTGDTRLACEAVLCLSSGTRPSECAPSLRRYFSIDARKLSDTIKERKNFLQLCPAASQDDNMRALVNDIANGAGRCDAASLNASTMVWRGRFDDSGNRYISNRLPSHCSNYANNAYTDVPLARYVGDPERGGYWVEASRYEEAFAEYNRLLAEQDQRYGNGNGREVLR
ncbi:conjugal transfer protein TrbM [Rhizobium sp. TRM95111]|uniref:TrbM/KikA/MpfK family conjugal transfer protein n=1 Tax=Rhizobium alarense TaxID=2846851 RepID=UPI001EED5DB1|nr:TrbM/KikA/MpfK family conjugal transfer protein [Rhizobium alarense]MCF3643137.1 conjugal transfer protein TrbM [Rhizobium alarense]